MDGGWCPIVVLRYAQRHAENPHGCAAMDGGWCPIVVLRYAQRHA
jgi:hypothetical protein